MVSGKFLRSYRFMIYEVIGLIVLGAFVRAMDAGLACPDWPLCFGDYIPDFQIQVYLEFIHRFLAGLIAIVCLLLNLKLIRNPKITESTKTLCWLSWTVLIAQIIMGGLTVTMELNEYVVVAHLSLALIFLINLLTIYYNISSQKTVPKFESRAIVSLFAKFTLAVIAIQIFLGGMVASHYAALVCADFPLCLGSFAPTFKGVIGLQVIHRLWAYLTVLVTFGFLYFVYKKKDQLLEILSPSKWLFFLLSLQVGVGIANVLFFTPPLLTVTHSLLAALLLINIWKINYNLFDRP